MMSMRDSFSVPAGLAVLAVWAWLAPGPAVADVRTLTATGEYRMGDNDTKTDAKRLALLDAKRQALEQVGSYLEGVTEVKNLSVTKDEIRSYTAGIVEVTEQSTRTALEGETTVVHVEVTVKVDTAVVTRQIRELRNNEQAKSELVRAKAEADLLRKELNEKNKQLAALKGGAAETAVQQRQQVMARADANELLARTWQIPAGTKDDIVIKTKTPTAEELAKYRTMLEQALRLDPNNPWAHFKLGHLYHSEGNLDAAIREYRTTIRLKPDADRPHLALGRALKAQGKKQEGAEEMMAYLMLAEKNPANKPLIGRTERKLNQLQRQGIRPRNPDAQSFSLTEDGRPPADSGVPPPSEFDRQPEPPQGFPPPRR
jgi:tetratricopeptide (TPR) repeat protein